MDPPVPAHCFPASGVAVCIGSSHHWSVVSGSGRVTLSAHMATAPPSPWPDAHALPRQKRVGVSREFATDASGKAKSMRQSNSGTNQSSVSKRSASAKARRATAKATAPASQAADKAAEKGGDATSAAVNGAERVAGTSTAVAHSAAERVEAGRQAVVAASGQAVAFARTAWTVIAHRKLVAAGVGAGLSALSATSYLAGHRAGRRTHGPLTRLTGGRI
ncbi:hypothetical protein GCM10010300_04780 [Streptomyces olivaceoviridis]|nr:hypothetical protein GCM10010300_04780 [Streptomyces olivaceoviridis]